MAYLDRQKLEARGLSPLDVMNALDNYNVFLPTGDAKLGDTDYAHRLELDVRLSVARWGTSRSIPSSATSRSCATWRPRRTPRSSRPTSCGSTARRRCTSRSSASSARARWRWSTASGSHLKEFTDRLTRSGIDLKLVMDQSVYVRQAISSLVQEGVLGAILCSLMILVFLGQWRMTAIAVMTLPISVLSAVHLPVRHGPDDQRDDPGRADAGDRADGRQRDHLPGEHAPASGAGCDAPTRPPTWGPARWRCPSWSRPSARSWCSRRWP